MFYHMEKKSPWICMKELQCWTLNLRRLKANEKHINFGGNLASIPSMSYIGTVRHYFQRVWVFSFLPGENCSPYIIYLGKLFVQKLLFGDSLYLKWWGEKNGNFVFPENSFSDAWLKWEPVKRTFFRMVLGLILLAYKYLWILNKIQMMLTALGNYQMMAILSKAMVFKPIRNITLITNIYYMELHFVGLIQPLL